MTGCDQKDRDHKMSVGPSKAVGMVHFPDSWAQPSQAVDGDCLHMFALTILCIQLNKCARP